MAGSPQPLAGDVPRGVRGLRDGRLELSALPLPEELFEQTVRALGASGFLGANVTIPHKHAALELADQASGPARAIGAANTLTFGADGTIEAHNTDAPGLIAALGRLTGMPAHPSALVLGAGGSARAAVWALQDAGRSEVSVWNRSPERALELARGSRRERGRRAGREPTCSSTARRSDCNGRPLRPRRSTNWR